MRVTPGVTLGGMSNASAEPGTPDPVFAIVIVAAGSGERLGYGMPKAKVPLGGEPMLVHALRVAAASGVARQICVAVPRGDEDLRQLCAEAAGFLPADAPEVVCVDGGATRADSVRAALNRLESDVTAVLVHDAARALAPESVFQRVAHALSQGALAVIPALPVVDTVKTVSSADGPAADVAPEVVVATTPRERLRAVQTPQGFDLATLRKAHDAAGMFTDAQAAAVTDDAMLVESLGVAVHVVPGSTHSLKITTPTDLLIAEALLEGPLAPRWVEG